MIIKGIFSPVVSILIITIICTLCCTGRNEPVEIGAILSLTGPTGTSYEGIEARDGMLLAAKEVNEWGGINGRPLKLIIEDAKSDADTAKKAYQSIETMHKPLIYISALSSISLTLAPYIEQSGSMQIALMATIPEITKNYQHVYRFWPKTEDQIPILLDLIEMLDIHTIGIIYMGDESGESFFTSVKNEFVKKGRIVKGISIKNKESDFTAELKYLINTDGLYIGSLPVYLVPIAGQIKKMGYKHPIITINGAGSPEIRKNPDMENIYFPCPLIYMTDNEYAKKVEKGYKTAYGKEFSHFAANGYDIIRIIAGLLETGESTREAIRKKFADGFHYTGCFGTVKLEKGGKDFAFPLSAAQITGGEIRYLK